MTLSKESKRYACTYKQYDELYHEVAQKHGLSDSALWLLYLICKADAPCTQNELAQELYIPKQTVNSAINKLVKDGFVELMQRPGPRNSKAVHLTAYGLEQCREYVYPLIQAEDRAISRMSPEEQALFLALHEKHYQYLKEEIEALL